MHTKSLDSAWPTILSLAGRPTATPDDPVSTEPFSLADIAEAVAESAAAQGDVVGLLWRGIFVLRDGRAAAVFGHTVDGWRSGSAMAYVGSSVSILWRHHGRGNARFALYGQYQRWHATWCAKKLIAFLECGDRMGWSRRRLLGDGSQSAAWVLDEELIEAMGYAPAQAPVRVVFVEGSESPDFAMASRIVPIDYRGFDRVLCSEGHLTLLEVEPPPLDRLDSWRCHCSAKAAWFSPLNMVEEPAGIFAKTYAGACGLRKKGARPASVSESKRAGASSASSKQCDSCRELFDGEALTASDRANDFWRCAGCNGRIFAMLAEGGGAARCASDQYEMADPDRWNWQRRAELVA